MPAPARRVAVVGAGVMGLGIVQAVLDRSAATARDVAVAHVVHLDAPDTVSRSGGLALPYGTDDPRAERWAARSAALAGELAGRHGYLRSRRSTSRTWLVRPGAQGPAAPGPATPDAATPGAAAADRAGEPDRSRSTAGVQLPPGSALADPAALGLAAHLDVVRLPGASLWDACALLPAWSAALAADPRVTRVRLDEPLHGPADVAELVADLDPDVTVLCLGLGAHVLGDSLLGGRLGVLLAAALPRSAAAGVPHPHLSDAVVRQLDDPARPRYSLPHLTGDRPHLHVGGTYLAVDDPADWADPQRLRPVATEEAARIAAEAPDALPRLAELGLDLGRAEVWWGLRPYRPSAAVAWVAADAAVGMGGGARPPWRPPRRLAVVHGHGGSGWTLMPAVADEVAESVLAAGEPSPLDSYEPWSPDRW